MGWKKIDTDEYRHTTTGEIIGIRMRKDWNFDTTIDENDGDFITYWSNPERGYTEGEPMFGFATRKEARKYNLNWMKQNPRGLGRSD